MKRIRVSVLTWVASVLIFGVPATVTAQEKSAEGPPTIQKGESDAIFGACCFEDGSCCVLGIVTCHIFGGEFQGFDTDCEEIDCGGRPETFGACCFEDGTCCVIGPITCFLFGGEFQGFETDCDICDEVVDGACCFADGSCLVLSQSLCESEGGEYQGDDTDCEGVNCPPPVDPCDLPGRPANDGTGDRVLRGYVIGWAVDGDGNEVVWNHLSGTATIVNWRDDSAWEYNAWTSAAIGGETGDITGTPGALNFDGVEYTPPYSQLLMQFQASGSTALSIPSLMLAAETDLTLHPLTADVTMNSAGPPTTQAHFDVWNENETKLSGAYRCVTCWDQTLLTDYGIPNHFTMTALQTAFGQARIDGLASPLCPDSADLAMLGVVSRDLRSGPDERLVSGTNLIGMGSEPAVFQYDIVEPPPESAGTAERMSGTEKGSVVVFSSVEIRWDEFGNLIQDTFISLSNDYPDDTRVLFYIINGDAPLAEPGCDHPGWNWMDNEITLTGNEPTWWSVLTGEPKGMSPFTVLDP